MNNYLNKKVFNYNAFRKGKEWKGVIINKEEINIMNNKSEMGLVYITTNDRWKKERKQI